MKKIVDHFDAEIKSRIIEMAWEDRTTFEAIKVFPHEAHEKMAKKTKLFTLA